MLYNYILGNIFSFLCAILISWSTFLKNKKDMMKVQILNSSFSFLSNIFFNSYSAAIVNLINVIRNYLVYKQKITIKIIIVCIFNYIVLGLLFNTKGVIGILPILASSIYTIFCLLSNNAQSLRIGLFLNQLLWIGHDLYIKAYPSLIIEIVISIITLYNIIIYIKIKND